MLETTPFLTNILDKKTGNQYLCVIQLASKNYVSFYDLNELKPDDGIVFLKLAKSWWNKCPIIPISIYHREYFKKFNYAKKWLASNNYKIISGFPGINLKSLAEKRIKRTLVHYE